MKDLRLFTLNAVVFTLFLCIPTTGKTQDQTLWEDLQIYGGQITTVAVDPDNQNILYCGSWGGNGLFKSTDGGSHWYTIPQDKPSWFRNSEVYDIAVDPNNPGNIWVASGMYVDFSYNYGEDSWYWIKPAGDENRFCYSIAIDPFDTTGNTVFVGTSGPDGMDEYGEIYKTTDGGITWDAFNFDTSGSLIWNNFWSLRFNPHVPDELWSTNRRSYLYPEGKIFVSPDNGDSWWYWVDAYWPYDDAGRYLFGYLDDIVISPSDPDIILSAGQYGIMRKQEGQRLETGWIWTEISDGCRALCMPFHEKDTVYAGLDSLEVARSTDNGISWNYYTAPAEFLTLNDDGGNPPSLIAGSVNQGVWKSLNAAASWSPVNIGVKANSVFSVDVSPHDLTTVLVGSLSGVYISSDLSHWSMLHQDSSKVVSFHPTNSGILYAGFDWRLGKSTDSGSNWITFDASDSEEAHEVSSLAIIPSENNTDIIYAGLSYGSGKYGEIVQINDWGYEYYDTSEIIFTSSTPVNSIAINPTDNNIIFAGTGSYFAPTSPGGLYLSADHGRSWTALSPDGSLTVNAIAIAPSNPDIVYIGCGASDNNYSGIYKTTDGGTSWESAYSGLPDYFSVVDITVDRQNPDIVYAALSEGYYDDDSSLYGGIYISVDGGAHWSGYGLSDYTLYAVNSIPFDRTNSRVVSHASSGDYQPPGEHIIAGSSSGMYKSSMAGVGFITGTVVNSSTGSPVQGVLINTSVSTPTQSDSSGLYLICLPAGTYSLSATCPGYASQHASVTVHAGEILVSNLYLSGSSTTTSVCVAEEIYHTSTHTDHLRLFREFRNDVLAKTIQGKRLMRFYETLGPDIKEVLFRHPGLMRRTLTLASRAVPLIQSARNGQKPSMPPSLYNDISRLLFDIEQASPTRIKKRIGDLRIFLRRTSFASFLAP